MGNLTKEEESAWSALLERALTALDEQESERYTKRVSVAKKKLERRGLKEAPIDYDGVKRFLLRYSECRDGEGYMKAIQAVGVSKLELVTAYDLWPDSRTVYEYVAGMRLKLQEIENKDLLDDARAGLRKLVTVEGCELNAKAVITTVERLDRKNFGDERSAAAASGKAQVTYNCPGLTVNMIMAPSEVARRGLAEKAVSEVIEVKEET